MKNIPGMIAMLLLFAATAACNTTRGIGQDVKATGEKIEEIAEDAKDELNDDDR